MTASLLNGKHLSQSLEGLLAQRITSCVNQTHLIPGLAVIRIGEDKASHIYVEHKRKACARIGIKSFAYDLPFNTTEQHLLQLIQQLNEDTSVHGILVQLPLPKHINTEKIIEAIDYKKDVDGFHPYNVGRLAQGSPLLRPCTPYGIIKLLEHYQLTIEGQHAVIIGASNIVGRPMAFEFLLKKATVTVCHSATQQLEKHVRCANILVVATGVHNLVHPEWLNKSQIVIDVGMHRNAKGIVHGDLDFQRAQENVAYITPVPGGVGPMTIYTLLENTVNATYR